MNCKNCGINLKSEDNYCFSCGAKVINERITLKSLGSDVLLSLGWDSQFWATLRDLLLRPGLVFDKYINGTRKKYSNPFAFFAIVTTITVLTIGFYTNEMIEISTNVDFTHSITSQNSEQDSISMQAGTDQSASSQIFIEKMTTFLFKYYYYISFLFLPFYTFIAFLVFGKPNNFAEHLIINSFIIGQTSILGLLIFLISLITKSTEIYYWGQFGIAIIYYSYAYKNYRNYSLKQLFVKILRFLVVVLIISVLFSLLIFVVAIIVTIIKKG